MYCPYCSSKAVESVHIVDKLSSYKRDLNWLGGKCHSCGAVFPYTKHRINQLHKRHRGTKGFWIQDKYPLQRVKYTEEDDNND